MKAIGFVVFALIATTVAIIWAMNGGPSWYGIAVMSLLSIKLVLSWRSPVWTTTTAAQQDRVAGLTVGIAIPMFNEDPDIIAASLASVLAQTRLPQSVVIVDDGSSDTRAYDEAETWVPRFQERGIPLTIIRFAVNQGKRHGLVACLEAQPGADLMLCVDSDTVLDPRALEQAVMPFHDDRVTVVTGLVLALNYRTNLLTRLIDIRYANAFLFERAAYSALGAVLCACGSLAVYRTSLMQKYAEDFLTQTFLGKPAVFGDDRRLTNYGLMEGRVLFQQTAIAYTAVPERWGHYLRQQVRWNKSFFRESVWAITHLPMSGWPFWLTLTEIVTWGVFSIAAMYSLIIAPVLTGTLLIGPYLIYLVLAGYARSVRYLDLTGVRQTRRDQLIGFAISPLYGVIHIVLLLWLRVYALLTLRSANWGTRSSVEVTYTEQNNAV